jgi:hypothetical protein
MENTYRAMTRDLNDHFRQTFSGGRVLMTPGITALPNDSARANVLESVRTFDQFTDDNDPHGEHDCAIFTVDGTRYMWKIDYYDEAMEHGSEEPWNPQVTTRVLTIMLASEY